MNSAFRILLTGLALSAAAIAPALAQKGPGAPASGGSGLSDIGPAAINAEQAAAYDNGEALFNLAFDYEEAGDFVTAARLYEAATSYGHITAPTNHGYLHANGGVNFPVNDVEALRLFRLGWERGDMMAANNIGVFYDYGRGGLTQDRNAAIEWYRIAANQTEYPEAAELAQQNLSDILGESATPSPKG